MFLEKLTDIAAFVFDVDGVLTNGTVLATNNGDLLRSFSIKDGYALQLAAKKGYKICVISGGRGLAMQKRFENLGVADVFFGVVDKAPVLQSFMVQNSLSPSQVLYMGDDIPDYEVMCRAGIAACPADAVGEIKQICHYVSPFGGGNGAARDVIEKVLKSQKNWFDPHPDAAQASK